MTENPTTDPTTVPPEPEPETVNQTDAPPEDVPTEDTRSDYDRFREETPDDYNGDVDAFNRREVPTDEKGALRDDDGHDHANEAVMRSVTGHNPPED